MCRPSSVFSDFIGKCFLKTKTSIALQHQNVKDFNCCLAALAKGIPHWFSFFFCPMDEIWSNQISAKISCLPGHKFIVFFGGFIQLWAHKSGNVWGKQKWGYGNNSELLMCPGRTFPWEMSCTEQGVPGGSFFRDVWVGRIQDLNFNPRNWTWHPACSLYCSWKSMSLSRINHCFYFINNIFKIQNNKLISLKQYYFSFSTSWNIA